MNSEPKERYSRAGRKHIHPKNTAFVKFESDTGLLATDAVFEYSKVSHPRIVTVNNQDVAMVDVDWAPSTECINCLSGSRETIRRSMDPADWVQFVEIMKDDNIRSTFEATRNNEDE